MLNLDNVYRAKHALREVIYNTDLIYAKSLSEVNDIFLKAENLQITGSFKVRGAYYKISTLTEKEREKGIIACSAGNHAQGVALSGAKLNVKTKIFIPSLAPLSKVEATKKYGAEVVLIDGIYDDAYLAAKEEAARSGAIFIHPFDDEDVMAGQGTIGLELLDALPSLDAVVIPIGGGGLASGVAYTIKTLKPSCKVYGVQAAGASSMFQWVQTKTRSCESKVSTFADGIAVKNPGELTCSICEKYLDGIVTVTEDEIATAILTLMEQQKLVAEGAGAVSVAAVMFNKLPIKNKKVVCIVSGGNIDVTILSRVIHRGLLTSGRLTDLGIELLDKPGELKKISSIIADLGANVVRVNHNYGGENSDINGCYLKLSLETRNHEHLRQIKEALIKEKYKLIGGMI